MQVGFLVRGESFLSRWLCAVDSANSKTRHLNIHSGAEQRDSEGHTHTLTIKLNYIEML